MSKIKSIGRVCVVGAAVGGVLFATALPSQASNDWKRISRTKFNNVCAHHHRSPTSSTDGATAFAQICWNGSDVAIRVSVMDTEHDGRGAVAQIGYNMENSNHYWRWHKRHTVINRSGSLGWIKASGFYEGNYPVKGLVVRAEEITKHKHFVNAGPWK